MIWKSEPLPKELQTRFVKKFSILPVLLDSGYYVWLGCYYEKFRFESYGYTGRLGDKGSRCENKPEAFGSLAIPYEYSKGKALTVVELEEDIDNFY